MTAKANQSLSKRFRDYGFNPGLLPIGRRNLISDVAGVKVGHLTKVRGNNCRTGVTLIDPGVKNLYNKQLPAAVVVGNGYGKLAGFTQLEELGTLEAPIALTNTLAVGSVMRGVVDLVLKQDSLDPLAAVNAVVGEINDGRVNDIHRNNIIPADVSRVAAKLSADFALGSVGGGTGARAFAWKGGIGSSSRVVNIKGKKYVVGALIQTNFGGSLTMMGVPIGQLLGEDDFNFAKKQGPDGSCMIVIATNAPLSARQLKRVASRALLGMVRTGSIMAHASGDYSIAFSTSRVGLEETSGPGLSDELINPFFLAAVEAVEESIYDALFAAETMVSKLGTLQKLPINKVVELIKTRQ